MALSQDEATFVESVSRETGLDPRVLVAWVQAEGAYAPSGTGGHNYLNLRPYGGDPYSSVSAGGFEQFSTVQDAVTATVRRLRQPFASAIISSARGRQTPEQEIAAIASTGWDAAHYGGTGGPNLRNTFAGLFTASGLSSPYEPPSSAHVITQTAGTGSAADAGSADITGSGGRGTPVVTPIANAAVGTVKGTVAAIDSVPKLIAFLTSWRFAELVGGFLLLVVGLVLLGRQLGVSVPAPSPFGSAADSARQRDLFAGPSGETAYGEAQPRSRPRKTRTVSRTLDADRRPARRSTSRQSDTVPF